MILIFLKFIKLHFKELQCNSFSEKEFQTERLALFLKQFRPVSVIRDKSLLRRLKASLAFCRGKIREQREEMV